MSTVSEMTLAAETMMATAASTTNAMAAVAAAHHAAQGCNSIENIQLEFQLEKWLEIPF